ncbi:MAG: hypothetical protein QOJ69_897 [Actinomycetota bacterium]|nr:hypothetical protein [Actinomycetota bacterium]
MLFRLDSLALALVVLALVGGATAGGIAAGRLIEEHRGTTRESVGAAQGALLGFVGLLLAFGMTMAVGRYESRRAAVVDEANAIDTTYLRAQTLAEPERGESLTLLRQYTDSRLALSRAVPGTVGFRKASDTSGTIQNQLWGFAGSALAKDPTGSATRLYVDSLNGMIDMHTVRVSALDNRVPTTVVYLQLLGGAFAVGLLAMYLAMLGRSVTTAILAAAMVCLILLVSLDLDRPVRGLITIPSTPIAALRVSMDQPPAATAPAPR